MEEYTTANSIALQTVALKPQPNKSDNKALYPYPTIPAMPVPDENEVMQADFVMFSCFINLTGLSSDSAILLSLLSS